MQKRTRKTVKSILFCLMVLIFSAVIEKKQAKAEELMAPDEVYQNVYDETIAQMEKETGLDLDGSTEEIVTIQEANTLNSIDIAYTDYMQCTDEVQDEYIQTTDIQSFHHSEVLTITAYCTCSKCCGNSKGKTASGTQATAWHTVAAGSKFSFGTRLYIPDLANTPSGGYFTVEDRGSRVSNSKIDVCLSNHQEAQDFGRRRLEVYVLN